MYPNSSTATPLQKKIKNISLVSHVSHIIAWIVREIIFITSETWIDLLPNLRSRNKIKLFRLHQKSINRRSSIQLASHEHSQRTFATYLNSMVVWVWDNDPICVWNCDVMRMFLNDTNLIFISLKTTVKLSALTSWPSSLPLVPNLPTNVPSDWNT